MSRNPASKKDATDWFKQFFAADVLHKVGMLGEAAYKLTSNLVDQGVAQAGNLLESAEKAFLDGYDPDVEEAKVIEEVEARRSKPAPPDSEVQ